MKLKIPLFLNAGILLINLLMVSLILTDNLAFGYGLGDLAYLFFMIMEAIIHFTLILITLKSPTNTPRYIILCIAIIPLSYFIFEALN